MKRLALITSCIVFLLASCSAEENVVETNAGRFDKEAIAKGLADSWANFHIDFTKLFDYKTTTEAKNNIHKALKFIEEDTREELASRPDCTKAYIGFYVFGGKASLMSVCFVDSNEKIVRENFVYFDKGIRDYTYIIDKKQTYLVFENVFNDAEQLFRGDDYEAIGSFLVSKIKDTKTPAQFIVVIDASDTVVLGMS